MHLTKTNIMKKLSEQGELVILKDKNKEEIKWNPVILIRENGVLKF